MRSEALPPHLLLQPSHGEMEICEPCDPCESPLPSPPSSDTANSPSQSRKSRGGCSHYTRGCKLRAPCCNELFSCRFCHDTAKSENERDPQAKHCMNRHHVRSVVCEACDAEQPPGPSCTSCGHSFGQYFCSVCNLYDDDLTKQQFHCEKCGICRVGGRENFFHCETCGACYSVELRNNHVCVPNSMQRDCPICYEYLFDSLEAPQVRVHEESAHSSGGGTRRAHYVAPLCCCHALPPDSHARLSAPFFSGAALRAHNPPQMPRVVLRARRLHLPAMQRERLRYARRLALFGRGDTADADAGGVCGDASAYAM